MTRKILFFRWADPIHPLLNDKPAPAEDDDPDYRHAVSTFDDGDEAKPHPYHEYGRSDTKFGPSVMGPHGIVPLHESNVPSKLYNFWIGHTDFGITDRLAFAIECVPGVETLDVFSRYRFRFAVGKAFDERKVKAAIELAVQPKVAPKSPAAGLDTLKAIVAKQHPFWVILRLPNGKFDTVGGASRKEVAAKTAKRPDATAVASSWGTNA